MMPDDEADMRFAVRIAVIMEMAKGTPLTADERARAHQYVAEARALFEAAHARHTKRRAVGFGPRLAS